MTEYVNWRDVKATARTVDPAWDSPERVEQRRQIREQMIASVTGARLADIRKELGMTQAQLGEATGLSQARISQIEQGEVIGLDVLRTYVTGLGGQVRVTARIGEIELNVA